MLGRHQRTRQRARRRLVHLQSGHVAADSARERGRSPPTRRRELADGDRRLRAREPAGDAPLFLFDLEQLRRHPIGDDREGGARITRGSARLRLRGVMMSRFARGSADPARPRASA